MENELTKASFVYMTQDDKVLLLQESGRLSRGRWSFPGGHVEPGESFEQGAIREAFEESGYQVKLDKIIYHKIIPNTEYLGNSRDTDGVELTIFAGTIIGGAMQIDNEALDLQWFNKKDALTLPLRWEFLKDLI
ncbi:MAG: NUDIX hydrolase [Patescibacteria group bacterium]